ncbi:hypothetical protein DTO271G3_2716 [Paecilomyces variotii]|nr:hypothetical protein DTO271G3_2716 [Paecilomyces variotii]
MAAESFPILTLILLYQLFWAQLGLSTTYPITEDLYTRLVRYTRFSAAAYSSDCRVPPGGATVVSYINNNATDTQATLFRDDANQDLILAFRGTSSVQDFSSDFNQTLVPFSGGDGRCENCTVHGGYFRQWKSVAAVVTEDMKSSIADYPTYTISVTGHSMGASLAAFAAQSLHASFPDDNDRLTAYTYGQPRTGNPSWAAYMDSLLAQPGKLFRVTHANDGVPQVPSISDGYLHHEEEYWANDPPSVENTVRCEGDEPPDCNLSEPGIGIGNDGKGINLAHLVYFGISIGNPVDPGLSVCSG